MTTGKATSRRAAILTLMAQLTRKGDDVQAEENPHGFDYVNIEFPIQTAVDEQCPEDYAYSGRRDWCVSRKCWCLGELWYCPKRHHGQCVCNMTKSHRPNRCCRPGWPPTFDEEGNSTGAGKGDCPNWHSRKIQAALAAEAKESGITMAELVAEKQVTTEVE